MKKIFSFLLLLLVLQSCSGDSPESASGLILQETDTFSILTPENWMPVLKSNIPIPKAGNVVLAYASNSERQGYLNNLVILETEIVGKETAVSLMKSSIQSLKNNIQNFEILSEKIVTFGDNQSGTILTYTGKYNTTTPEAIYLQTVRVCGDKNYHVTLSLTEELESYDRYEYILQTFECKS